MKKVLLSLAVAAFLASCGSEPAAKEGGDVSPTADTSVVAEPVVTEPVVAEPAVDTNAVVAEPAVDTNAVTEPASDATEADKTAE
jgi:PBP1b-binding outer membrane lipoprotein LpoB